MNNQAAQTMPELPAPKYKPEHGVYDESSLRAGFVYWENLMYLDSCGEDMTREQSEDIRRRLLAVEQAMESHDHTINEDDEYVPVAALSQPTRVPAEKIAPVQGYTPGIPWSMHLEAYDVYCKRYGKQPALIDLEGRNCRGGFGTNELDMFIPGWRDRLSEFNAMKARIAELEAMLAAAPAARGGEEDQ